MVVEPATDLLAVQSDDGSLVSCDRLGPGIVEEVAHSGEVRVHWVEAGLDLWMEPGDLRTRGDDAHLIAVTRFDSHGRGKPVRHAVVARAGFHFNWTVELRPKNIVRVIRSDGAAWTFYAQPLFRRISTDAWNLPPEDDDAEAVVVAEFATYGRG